MMWSNSCSVSMFFGFCQNLGPSTNSTTSSSRFSLNKRMSSFSSRNLRKLVTTSSGNAASRTADAWVNVTRQKEFGSRFDVANSRRGRKPESAGDAGRGSWCRVGLGSIARVWMKNEREGGQEAGRQTVDVMYGGRATQTDDTAGGFGFFCHWPLAVVSAYESLKQTL
jgi:hypothetical protein